MLELSPLLTAANAAACSMPASMSVSRSKPMPVTRRPREAAAQPAEGLGSWSIMATVWPLSSRMCARVDPTRPQPMITICTVVLPDVAPGRLDHAEPTPGRGHLRFPADRRVFTGTRNHSLTVVPQATDLVKRLLLGRALRSAQAHEQLLPKRIALPVFASDALSSVAYAPQEILIALGLAGLATYHFTPCVGRRRHRDPAGRGRLLPPERARLHQRRRRLRGRDHEPGGQRRARRRQRADGRLRAHRRRVGVLGGAEPGCARPLTAVARGARRGRWSSSSSPC